MQKEPRKAKTKNDKGPKRRSKHRIQPKIKQKEIDELKAEMTENPDPARLQDELGDMLFVMANLARKIGVDPEVALRGANHKFTKRFHFIEDELARDGRTAADSDLAEMDSLWDVAKKTERGQV